MRLQIDLELGLILVLVAAMAFAVIKALGFPHPANTLPLVVGVPTLALGVVVLVEYLVQRWRHRPPERVGESPVLSREARGVGSLLGAAFMMWLIGMTWTVPLYIFLYMLILGRVNLYRSLILSAAIGAVVYVLFSVVLGLQLYSGWLWHQI